MFLLAKYNTQTDIRFPMIKAGVRDFAVTGDWTPATGDTKVSKDGGSDANTTNNPAIVAGTKWKLTLTATELSCAEANIAIVDSATKAVEDQFLTVYTYGNASAKIIPDWSDIVRMGLTALPNAAAEAAGGLYTRGTGAGQVNQPANGLIDANTLRIAGTAASATALNALAGRATVGTVATAGFTPTATAFECSDITEATASHYVGCAVYATSGSLAGQCLGVVTAYTLTGGRGHFTVTPGSPTSEALANTNTVLIV